MYWVETLIFLSKILIFWCIFPLINIFEDMYWSGDALVASISCYRLEVLSIVIKGAFL